MIDKIKAKIVNILDSSGDKLPFGFFAAIAVITSIITKAMGFSFIIVLLISVTVLMGLATIVQIARNKRNRRKIYIYLGATISCIFMAVTAAMMQYYVKVGNNEMFANVIKVFLSVLAIIMNWIGIIYIKNKENPRGRRVTLIICMIYFTIIAISAIIFLPPNSM